MILYHGSDHIIEKPVFGEGKSYDATYVIDIIRNNWKNGQGI